MIKIRVSLTNCRRTVWVKNGRAHERSRLAYLESFEIYWDRAKEISCSQKQENFFHIHCIAINETFFARPHAIPSSKSHS